MKYEPLFHVVLHQPEIPPNAGNIGRSCVAVGAKLWMVRPLGFLTDDRSVRRAGLDYWQHLELEIVDDWPTLVERLAGLRFWCFTKRANRIYTTADFRRDDVLVFGCETSGLPDEILAQHAETAVRLPMRPQVRSLNLASSATAAMYEAVRQIGVQFPSSEST